MKKENKVLLGVILILVALMMILQDSRFYYLLPFIGGWSVLELLVAGILIYWTIKHIIKKSFISSSFFFGVFLLLNKANLNIAQINNWKIILVCFLIGLGLTLMLNGKEFNVEYKVHIDDKKRSRNSKKDNKFFTRDNFLKIDKVFSSSVEYIEPMDFEGGDIELVFSNLSIYLDKVELTDDIGYLHIEPVFSSLSLYIPKDWEISSEISLVGANISEHNYDKDIVKNKRLKLSGDGVFSSIKIYYI